MASNIMVYSRAARHENKFYLTHPTQPNLFQYEINKMCSIQTNITPRPICQRKLHLGLSFVPMSPCQSGENPRADSHARNVPKTF